MMRENLVILAYIVDIATVAAAPRQRLTSDFDWHPVAEETAQVHLAAKRSRTPAAAVAGSRACAAGAVAPIGGAVCQGLPMSMASAQYAKEIGGHGRFPG